MPKFLCVESKRMPQDCPERCGKCETKTTPITTTTTPMTTDTTPMITTTTTESSTYRKFLEISHIAIID